MTPASVRATVAALSGVLALGCAALAIGHSGVNVPLLSQLGPGGDRAIVPAAIAFSVATVALVLIAFGVSRGRSWSWALGVVVHALIFLGAAAPFRGVASAVAMVITAAALALLVSRPGRAALLAR